MKCKGAADIKNVFIFGLLPLLVQQHSSYLISGMYHSKLF